MRHLFAVSAAALLWSAATAFAADPVGSYSASRAPIPAAIGKYSGTVTVEKTGETYRVIWVVAGTRYIGTGIGNKDFIAVSYKSGSDTGLALYGADGGNWTGIWTYAGGRRSAPKSGSANSPRIPDGPRRQPQPDRHRACPHPGRRPRGAANRLSA